MNNIKVCVLLLTIFAMIELNKSLDSGPPAAAADLFKKAEELADYRFDAIPEFKRVKMTRKYLKSDMWNATKMAALKNAIEAMKMSVKTKYLNQLIVTNDFRHSNQIVNALNEQNFKRKIELLKEIIARQTNVMNQKMSTLDAQIHNAIEIAYNALTTYPIYSAKYIALATAKANLETALTPEASVVQKRISLNQFQELYKALNSTMARLTLM